MAKKPITRRAKSAPRTSRRKSNQKKKNSTDAASTRARFPRHSVEKALRIPKALLEQNAGKQCTNDEAAKFIGVSVNGPFNVEVSSAIKFGFLDRPSVGVLQVSDLAKKILRPKAPSDEVSGYRQAILNAPDLKEIYAHYRGENLPDEKFFRNAAIENFNIPADSFDDFRQIFIESLKSADLMTEHDGKIRIIDGSDSASFKAALPNEEIKKTIKSLKIEKDATCFVMQPFAPPLGEYFDKIYKPAIEKAGMKAVRADAEIFGTGKIIDQVYAGIKAAQVLVAELTSRNPNVFYELGVAHALQKPVVLISASELDVPFDLKHIRVIYYDVSDPYWGEKLKNKSYGKYFVCH